MLLSQKGSRKPEPLVWVADSKLSGISRYILPLVMGSVQQLPSLTFGDNTLASITLIARRSTQRSGVRHWRRGADAEAS